MVGNCKYIIEVESMINLYAYPAIISPPESNFLKLCKQQSS